MEYVDRRVSDSWPMLRADYTYYANGLMHTVTYANGASIEYTYDDADRLKIIDHRIAIGLTMLKLRYMNRRRGNWMPSGLVQSCVSA